MTRVNLMFKLKTDKGTKIFLCSFFPDNEVTLNDSCNSIICFSIRFFFFVVHCMQEDSWSDVSNHIVKILVVRGADEDPADTRVQQYCESLLTAHGTNLCPELGIPSHFALHF